MQVKRSRNEKEIKNGYERQKEHNLVFDLNGGMPQMAQALPLATLLQVFPIRMKGIGLQIGAGLPLIWAALRHG